MTVEIALRRFPYPYRALLSICSDLDETPDRRVYFETARFLNTTETTAIGPGVGLEVGNTVYFDMAPDQFAYWTTDDKGRAMVRDLIRSGHIDCLHSFGDLATTRAHAGRALEELSRHDCRLEVWIDHGVARTNFGADIMKGEGDLPGAEAYHADLTCGFGVNYVWRGRVTSVIGQDSPRTLQGIYAGRHPLRSARTVAKEFAKGVLARGGSRRYAMHGPNDVLRSERLRDGRPVAEFLRANPHWGGVSCGETATGLPEVLTDRMLDRLVERGGVSILYTHLGKVADPQAPLAPPARAALARLAERHRAGEILVTTTRRLLGYCRAQREVSLSARHEEDDGRLRLEITATCPRQDLAGATVYVPDASRTTLFLDGSEVADLRRNAPDATGRPSVSIPWPRLEFPQP